LELQPIDRLKGVYEVNVFGLVRCTQAFLPLLRKSKGRVVNIGSIGGLVTLPNRATYCSTKFAVRALNDALRRELSVWEMSVSLLEPAYVKSGIAAKSVGGSGPHHKLSKADFELYGHVLKGFDERRLYSNHKGEMPTVLPCAVCLSTCLPAFLSVCLSAVC
jgi:short-subunit dehydrogenase